MTSLYSHYFKMSEEKQLSRKRPIAEIDVEEVIRTHPDTIRRKIRRYMPDIMDRMRKVAEIAKNESPCEESFAISDIEDVIEELRDLVNEIKDKHSPC